MWMSTTTRHWDLLEHFFFEKGTETDAKTTIQKNGRVDLEGPRTNVAIFYNPFKEDPNLPNYNLLRDLVQEMGHEMRHVYGNQGNRGDQC